MVCVYVVCDVTLRKTVGRAFLMKGIPSFGCGPEPLTNAVGEGRCGLLLLIGWVSRVVVVVAEVLCSQNMW